jgi:UDP-N-acetylglucosamine--N-acetylmuramyl-(pentapeptide) pyrophosphoryl-undecaprenol N-acetylglucosamine transferase
LRLLVAAGGTGGHLYPGLAVAASFEQLSGGADVIFVGTEKGLESRLVPAAGYELEIVRAHPLRGGSFGRKLAGVAGLVGSFVDAARLLARVKPTVVFGVGAYVSGATLLMAAVERIPTLLLEPNAEPGLANRWLGPFVDEAACAFEETTRYFGRKAIVTGNPVRKDIAEVKELSPQTADGMRILVFGGSQGSRALNRAVTESLSLLAGDLSRLEITHQTGPKDEEWVRKAYEGHGIARFTVVSYIDGMAEAYERADLVVCRAGATTCAELASAGRPSLLVPLAIAGGHQEANAEAMASAGAAHVIKEKDLSPGAVAREIRDFLETPETRSDMAKRARSLARPDAADAVARRLLDLARPGSGKGTVA